MGAIDYTEVIMFCSNCGSMLVDGAKFCSECGARVSRPEPEVRTFADIDFSEPETAKKAVEAAPATEETFEKPVREKVSFDWSNVVDEPHKKEVLDIKSPWGTTGGIDEKELSSEMSNPGGKSRTMSFIDVLKAEKEEREKAAADKAIEYTEVLRFDHELDDFNEIQGVRLAPLYDDVDVHVTTPFDEPEFEKPDPAVKDEPRFEEPAAPIEYNGLEKPEESELELSRETIAQFDEFVKSFEREAGITAEPKIEEPVYEEPPVSAPKFELPDFLKKITDFRKEEPKEEEEFEDAGFLSDEPPVIELDEEPEEPVYEEPSFEEPKEEPSFEEPAEEPVFEEPAYEAPAFEEPKYDAAAPAEEPEFADETMEDIYLGLEESETTGKFGTRVDLSRYEDFEDDDDEDEESEEESFPEVEEEYEEEDGKIDEDELFKEMEESKPQISGMTIAPPADKESEIEALRKRLAELTGVDLYAPADLAAAAAEEPEEEAEEVPAEEPAEEPADLLFEEPADDIFDEPEEDDEAGDFGFEPEVNADVDDLFEELTPASEKLTFVPEVNADVDELFESLTPASQIAAAEVEIPVEPAAEVEPAVEEVVEPVVEIPAEPVVEEEPAVEAPAEPSIEDLYLGLDDVKAEEPAPAEPVFTEPVVEERPPMPKAPVIRLDGAVNAAEPPAPEYNVEVPEELINEEVPDLFVSIEEPVVEEVVEPFVEEALEPVAEEVVEPVVEEAPAEEAKESDALSLEELERDLFGDALSEEAEAEETKKIDKFYTLYRKNEEFQRLLDEEYEKLRHGGGLTEEEKQAVDAIPKMAEVEAAAKAAAVAEEPAPVAAPETPAVPVEKEKAYRQVEDETIYMPKELVQEQMKVDFANAAAAKAPVEVPAEAAPKSKKEAKKEAKKAAKAASKVSSNGVEVEYEDVEHGSKFLTVLAVIIALILIMLLAVILILQIAPDSAAAAWIDSLINNITSKFSLISTGGEFLL